MGGIGGSSGWSGGRHTATVGGPGGSGNVGGFPPGGFDQFSGYGPDDMADALMPMVEGAYSEAMAGKKLSRKSAAYDLAEKKRRDAKARAPKMAAARRGGKPMDPMRYANKARTAARNDQFAQGGYGTYGQGRMAMAHEGNQAFEQAMSAYPAYFQSMMASGMV